MYPCKHWPDAGLMLAQRLRRWPSIGPTSRVSRDAAVHDLLITFSEVMIHLYVFTISVLILFPPLLSTGLIKDDNPYQKFDNEA